MLKCAGCTGGEDGDHDLPDQLVAGPDAVAGPDVQVVVDGAQGGDGRARPAASRSGVDQDQQQRQRATTQIRTPPRRRALLEWWLSGPSSRMCLPKRIERAKRMYGGIRTRPGRTRAGGPGSARSYADRSAPPAAPQVVDDGVERHAVGGLDQDRVAGAKQGGGGGSRPRRPATSSMASAAGRRRGRPRRSAGASPTTTSRSATAAARRPTSRWPAGALAQLEHLAQHRDPPAGQVGQDGQGGPHRGRGRVVGVVEDERHRHAQVLAVGRAPAERPGRPRCRRGQPGGQADRRRGQGVLDGMPAEPGQGDRPVHRRGAEAKRMPATPRARVAGGHVGLRREAVGQDRPRSCRRMPATSVVGVEDGRAARRQGLDEPALARSIASIEPIRGRWTGSTAVTTPMAGRAIRARSAISPPTYMPISRTSAWSMGSRRRTVRGRPISLFSLPSLQTSRVGQDRRDGLLGRGLGDAAGDADGERLEAARQAAAIAPRAATPSSTSTTVMSPSCRGAASGARPPSGPRRRRDGLGQVLVAVGPLAGQGDEQVARLDPPGIDRGARIGRPPERSTRPPLAAARPGASKAGRAGLGGGSRVASVTVGRHSPTRPLTVASRAAARRGPRACPAAASARSGRPCSSRPPPGAGDPGP